MAFLQLRTTATFSVTLWVHFAYTSGPRTCLPQEPVRGDRVEVDAVRRPDLEVHPHNIRVRVVPRRPGHRAPLAVGERELLAPERDVDVLDNKRRSAISEHVAAGGAASVVVGCRAAAAHSDGGVVRVDGQEGDLL